MGNRLEIDYALRSIKVIDLVAKPVGYWKCFLFGEERPPILNQVVLSVRQRRGRKGTLVVTISSTRDPPSGIDLKKKGIGCSIYYPHPVPRLVYYKKKYGYNFKDFLNASYISDYSIALPVGPHLKSYHIKIIASNFINIFKKYYEN